MSEAGILNPPQENLARGNVAGGNPVARNPISENLARENVARGNVATVTLGCRLNAAESSTIADFLSTPKNQSSRNNANGAKTANEATNPNPSIVVVNTCAVTNDAKQKSRQAVRRAIRRNPTARIMVTGCAVEQDPAIFAKMAEVVANRSKLNPAAWGITESGDKIGGKSQGMGESISEGNRIAFGAPEEHVRAYLQVQRGCDHSCTFCNIPSSRGGAEDIAAEDVANLAKRLLRRGHRELVLTGVDIASYGAKGSYEVSAKGSAGKGSGNNSGNGSNKSPKRLGDLVEELLERTPELTRLRLSSIDPAAVDEKLFDLLVGNKRLLPHVHLSIQAGSDLILKRMKRRHNRADTVALCQRLKAERLKRLDQHLSLGADLICGFPTESEEHFAQTEKLVAQCELAFIHPFGFSPVANTPAARMPQLPPSVIKQRVARLKECGIRQRANHFARLRGAAQVRVLAESPHWGRSDCYSRVKLDGTATSGKVYVGRVKGGENGEFVQWVY